MSTPATLAPPNVTELIIWDVHPDGTRSIEDILELDGGPSEALQMFQRHYIGGRYVGHGYRARSYSLRAGYRMADGAPFYPFQPSTPARFTYRQKGPSHV